MNKKAILIAVFLFGGSYVAWAMSRRKLGAFSSPVSSSMIRGCDPEGCGHFGANRGAEKHEGIDIVSLPAESVFAPIGGVVRPLNVYDYSSEMKGIEITDGPVRMKIFYLDTPLKNGDVIKKGQKIGVTQDVASFHNAPRMVNHLHIELYINGVLKDPTNFLR